jgi:hypothetical protein
MGVADLPLLSLCCHIGMVRVHPVLDTTNDGRCFRNKHKTADALRQDAAGYAGAAVVETVVAAGFVAGAIGAEVAGLDKTATVLALAGTVPAIGATIDTVAAMVQATAANIVDGH